MTYSLKYFAWAPVVCLLAGTLGWIHFGGPYLAGTDPYYHIKMSQLYRENGILRTFPWTQFSIQREHVCDKEFLYHVGMIPFVTGSWDPALGAKVYATLLGVVCISSILFILSKFNVRLASIWFLVGLSSGPLFLYRMAVVRPQLCGVTLALWSFYAIVGQRWWLLAGISFLYPLFYCAPHVAMIIAGIWVVAQFIHSRKWRLKPLWITTSCVIAGFLAHPHFPYMIRLWYVQNVEVLFYAISKTPGLNLAGELEPPTADLLIKECFVLFASIFGLISLALFKGCRLSLQGIVAFFVGAAFLILTCLSKRFIEYAVPFLTLFSGFLYESITSKEELSVTAWRRVFPCLLLIVSVALFFRAAQQTRMMIANTGAATLKAASIWLRDHSNAGDVVLTSDWDEFPELFFYNTKNYYIVALDPTFMLAADKRAFSIWNELRYGTRKDIHLQMKNTFKARYLLATTEFGSLIDTATRDERLQMVFSDGSCTIFEAKDGNGSPK